LGGEGVRSGLVKNTQCSKLEKRKGRPQLCRRGIRPTRTLGLVRRLRNGGGNYRVKGIKNFWGQNTCGGGQLFLLVGKELNEARE